MITLASGLNGSTPTIAPLRTGGELGKVVISNPFLDIHADLRNVVIAARSGVIVAGDQQLVVGTRAARAVGSGGVEIAEVPALGVFDLADDDDEVVGDALVVRLDVAFDLVDADEHRLARLELAVHVVETDASLRGEFAVLVRLLDERLD